MYLRLELELRGDVLPEDFLEVELLSHALRAEVANVAHLLEKTTAFAIIGGRSAQEVVGDAVRLALRKSLSRTLEVRCKSRYSTRTPWTRKNA